MQNGLFKLDLASIGDAVLMAVLGAVLTALYGVITAPGFDLFTANWGSIGHNMLNIAITAAVMSLGKDFFSTNNGSLLGVTPPTSSKN